MAKEEAIAKYTAEFVGTFLLVFTVGCNVISDAGVWTGTSIAAVLMVMIYALGGVSGGHFNPAVSVSLATSNKMEWPAAGIYAAVQVSGGIAAALCYSFVLQDKVKLAPKPGFGWAEAGLAELLYTCMLCFVVLNTAASRKNGVASGTLFYGLAIGFVIVAGAYGAGSISGGAFNPAVALGLDISSAGLGFGWGFAYVGFELAGALLAAGLFRLVRPDDFGGSENYELGTRCASEFIGTFFLVLTVGLNVLTKSPAGAWSIAASLMCMIFALGDCSGAHFNPAVTVAILLSGRGKKLPGESLAYIGAQLGGGVCAAFTSMYMTHGGTFAFGPKHPFHWGQALVGEAIFTFVLCFVVLSVATTKTPLGQYFGLAIGSCVTAGGVAIGNISGGALNPAVVTGISTARLAKGTGFMNCLPYAAAEFLGAFAAAAVFRVTHPSEFSKGALLPLKGSKAIPAEE